MKVYEILKEENVGKRYTATIQDYAVDPKELNAAKYVDLEVEVVVADEGLIVLEIIKSFDDNDLERFIEERYHLKFIIEAVFKEAEEMN